MPARIVAREVSSMVISQFPEALLPMTAEALTRADRSKSKVPVPTRQSKFRQHAMDLTTATALKQIGVVVIATSPPLLMEMLRLFMREVFRYMPSGRPRKVVTLSVRRHRAASAPDQQPAKRTASLRRSQLKTQTPRGAKKERLLIRPAATI